MNRNIIFIIILLTILVTAVGYFVISRKNVPLISPILKQNQVPSSSSPQPSASAYNPPKEIKFDGATDLKKELDAVNPQVLDSDFE